MTNMHFMFFDATAFNQNLSDWCVSNITSEPINFDYQTSSWTEAKPVWGACP